MNNTEFHTFFRATLLQSELMIGIVFHRPINILFCPHMKISFIFCVYVYTDSCVSILV